LGGTAPPLILLDRDGVINYDSDAYIRAPEEWRPLPGSLQAIAALSAHGYRVVVVSNQSGVGRGLFSEATLAAIHAKMTQTIEAAGGALAGIYYCPHRPDDACDCRKPAPGLLHRIARDFGCTLTGVPFVGDKLSDVLAADAVRAQPILVRTGSGAETLGMLGSRKLEVYDDLADAVRHLLSARD
jgi:D-glycero-D-manno-heptose 1,7-bisphosphate phosphatase